VQVDIAGSDVHVKGPNGEMKRLFSPAIGIKLEDGIINVTRSSDEAPIRALHGTTRALIQNMVTGVSEGYLKTLHIFGTGYSSEVLGPWLKLILGFSHDILLQIPIGLQIDAQPVARSKGTRSDFQSIINIRGIDKQLVGQFAAEIRGCRPPENYKGKGIRYHDEHVTIKAGKAGSK